MFVTQTSPVATITRAANPIGWLVKEAIDFDLLCEMEYEFETLRLNPDSIFLYAFKQAYLRKQ